ncbi:MAG TPA: hypothetical protein VI455_16775 [Terriglobia bacterium]
MQPRLRVRSIVLPLKAALIAVLVVGSAKVDFSAAAADNSSPDLLKLGTVKFIGPTGCPNGSASGATCKAITVSCPGLPDINATLGSAFPTGTARGTIILLSGGPGTTFFNSGFANAYLGDGFQVAQLAWASDWADANGAGVKSAACRPATVFKAVFNTVQHESRTTGFCGQGISGGSAALAYSLAHYGLSAFFDYVVLASGPGVARMDYGCDKSLYTGGPRNLCPLLPNAIFAYGSGKLVNGWENTTTCTDANPLQSDIDRWTADSIISTGASYSYPQTGMSWFFCATPPAGGGSTGQGSFLIDQVVPKNAPPDVNCYSGICQAEAVWQDPSAFSTTHSEMLAQCVPNH